MPTETLESPFSVRQMRGRSRRPFQVPRKEHARLVSDLEDHDAMVKSLMAKLRYASDFRQPWDDEWERAIRAWFQVASDPKEDSWESQRYLPIILKHVETALPAIVASVLDDRGIFAFSGLTPRGKEAARALTSLVNWQARHVSGAEEAYEDMFWWATLIGTAYLDHYWLESRQKRRVVDLDAEGNRVIVEKEILEHDEPVVECLNPLDVYPSPSGSAGDRCPWFFIRVETTIRDLREKAGKGHIDGAALTAWLESQPWKKANEDWYDRVTGNTWGDLLEDVGYADREDSEFEEEDEVTDDQPIVVWKYVSERETITLGDPERIIGYSENDAVHGRTGIVIHQFYKVPDCPFGRGIGGILRGHQELANENINRWMDAVVIEQMAPIVVDQNRARLLDDDLVLQPNAVIRTRGVDAVQRMVLPAPNATAQLMDSHLNMDADDLTGFTEQARGLAPSANQTATAFQGIQSNLRTRLVMHVRRSARTIRQSGFLMGSLNQQFLAEEKFIEITGEDGLEYVRIRPEDLVGEYVVGVNVSTSRAAPEVRAQRLTMILQTLVPLLQTGAIQNPMVQRLVRMVLEANEVDDVDKLIPRSSFSTTPSAVENELLKVGVECPVHPNDDDSLHLRDHTILVNELVDAGATDAELAPVVEHLKAHHAAIAQKAAAAMPQAGGAPGAPGAARQEAQGASGAGVGPGEGGPARQQANLAGQATGGTGTPNVAAPGPAAPGRLT